MTDFLTTLKELREKATPGVLEQTEKGFAAVVRVGLSDDDPKWPVFTTRSSPNNPDERRADTALIVHLVNHADLIEEMVEALEPFPRELAAYEQAGWERVPDGMMLPGGGLTIGDLRRIVRILNKLNGDAA